MGRRNNPDYSQITGLIPKALAQRFRVYCVEQEMMLTDALELAIQEFLDKRQPPAPASTGSRKKRRDDKSTTTG